MKLFKIHYLGGDTEIVVAKKHESVLKAAGLRGAAVSTIDFISEEPSMTMTEIATKVGLAVKETILCFRGLLGRPELRKADPNQMDPDLKEYWTKNPDENMLTIEQAEEFIRRIKEHLAQAATA